MTVLQLTASCCLLRRKEEQEELGSFELKTIYTFLSQLEGSCSKHEPISARPRVCLIIIHMQLVLFYFTPGFRNNMIYSLEYYYPNKEDFVCLCILFVTGLYSLCTKQAHSLVSLWLALALRRRIFVEGSFVSSFNSPRSTNNEIHHDYIVIGALLSSIQVFIRDQIITRHN